MEIYTIGFATHTAEAFFQSLKANRIQTLIDVRLRNRSQLSGFSKQDDLEYFLSQLVQAKYVHEPLLAPTDDLLDAYRTKRIAWSTYAETFAKLLRERNVQGKLNVSDWSRERTVLLCSEKSPSYCHRRLVLDYLKHNGWPDLNEIDL